MPSDSGRLSDPGTKEVCGRFANVSAALLLGGASSRMGTDKAALELGGVPFAARTARLLDRLFDELWLVGGTPPPEAPGRHVADAAGPRCALRGLVTALESATRERVLVLATDLPLVSPDLLLALVAWPEPDVVVPRRDGRRHPLCAIYRRERVLTPRRGGGSPGTSYAWATCSGNSPPRISKARICWPSTRMARPSSM